MKKCSFFIVGFIFFSLSLIAQSPDNLSILNLSATSAELSWFENGTATNWEILLVSAGDDTIGITPTSANENPYTYTGLSPSTEYEWYVRAVEVSGVCSNWAGPAMFKTYSDRILLSKTFGGSNEEYAAETIRTGDSCYLIVGFTKSDDYDVHGYNGGKDGWIIKINYFGDTLWTKTIGTADEEEFTGVVESSDNHYVLSGNHNEDYWIVKTDTSGNLIWQRTFGGDNKEVSCAIVESNDGGYVIGGIAFSQEGNFESHNTHNGESDFWVVKLDVNGNFVWSNFFGGMNAEVALDLYSTNDSNYLITGTSNSNDMIYNNPPNPPFFCTIEINDDGWNSGTETFFEITDDYWYHPMVLPLRNNNYFISWVKQTNQDGAFLKMKRINETGQAIWSKTQPGFHENYYTDGYLTDNNEIILSGTIGIPSDSYRLIKLNLEGTTIYEKEFNTLWSLPQSVIQHDNEVLIVGQAISFDEDNDVPETNGLFDIWAVKIKDSTRFECLKPTELKISNKKENSVELMWLENGDASTWEIMFDIVGFDTSGYEPTVVYENPLFWDGLEKATRYEWYIRAVCDQENKSKWVGPHQFRTYTEGVTFSKTFGGSEDETPYTIAQLNNGNYIVAGQTCSWDGDFYSNYPEPTNNNNYACSLIIDSMGNHVESNVLSRHLGSKSSCWHSVQSGGEDGYVLAGYQYVCDYDMDYCPYYAHQEMFVSNQIWPNYWYKNYKKSDNIDVDAVAKSVKQTTDGGFAVAGYSTVIFSDPPGYYPGVEYWILKLDEQGDVEWSKTYGGSNDDKASSIAQTDDDGYIVVGTSDSNDWDVPDNKGSKDIWILKLNNNGEIEWSKTIGGTGYEESRSMQLTNDGGFIVAGIAYTSDADVPPTRGESDYWIIKLSAIGEIEWSKTYGGSQKDEVYSIINTSDGGFVAVGYTESNDGDVIENNGSYDCWVIKIDNKGKLLWSKNLGGSSFDRAYSIIENQKGEYLIAAKTSSDDWDVEDNLGGSDFWIIKMGTQIPAWISASLPFTEDWESDNGILLNNNTILIKETHCWTFETDHQNEGRARWGTDAHASHSGDGALTLDRWPLGEQVKNKAILTLNLSNYTDSENLWLDFAWSDEREQDDAGDEVWVRGSEMDEWVMIYNINPLSGVNGQFNFVSQLDIDATLAAADPPQVVSESFQVCFGQEGLYWGLWGGITFDDISIYEETPCGNLLAVELPYVQDFESASGTSTINETMICTDDQAWYFETSTPGQGRVRWGTDAYLSHSGEGALSLDRHPGGEAVLNRAVLTLNMENYIGSEDLWLDFAWADHHDQDEAGDNVWIRGSIEDDWIVIYNINPISGVDDRFNYVSRLDIDEVLANADPQQVLSETFQVRFGQEGSLPIHWDGITFDDILLYEGSPCGPLAPSGSLITFATFLENWESESGMTYTNQTIYCGENENMCEHYPEFCGIQYYWAFETDHPLEGRARWGEEAFTSYMGNGAITLDRYPGGELTKNAAILTINMNLGFDVDVDINYLLSFAWTDHNDTDEAGDNVWVRGSIDDNWVVIYNINPQSTVNGEFTLVEDLDIIDALANANPPQELTESFQIKFGQEGKYFDQWGGLTFDQIQISINADKSKEVNPRPEDEGIIIFSNNDNIYIKSEGDAILEEKQVEITDLFGRIVYREKLPPQSLSVIKVHPCNCYLVVKATTTLQVKVEKVFVK